MLCARPAFFTLPAPTRWTLHHVTLLTCMVQTQISQTLSVSNLSVTPKQRVNSLEFVCLKPVSVLLEAQEYWGSTVHKNNYLLYMFCP